MSTNRVQSAEQLDIPKGSPRRCQSRLQTLLICVPLCALGFNLLAVKLERARRQREAVLTIEEIGGSVIYEGDSFILNSGRAPKKLTLIQRLLGQDFFFRVESVAFPDMVPVVNLTCLHDLPDIRRLALRTPAVTDASLAHLRGLAKLEYLNLNFTNVAGPGLVHLKDLPSLRGLGLGSTPMGNAELAYVGSLTQLTALGIGGKDISDAGLEHLTSLHRLESLDVFGTKVTREGLDHLQKALPSLKHVFNHAPRK